MNKYQIVYKCSNGYIGTEYVDAANRIMAFEVFETFGVENVVDADCFRVTDDEVI